MGRIRIIMARSDPDMAAINEQCGRLLDACDEKNADLCSVSLALASARISRKVAADEGTAWNLAVAALQAAFAFDERAIVPQWEPTPSVNGHIEEKERDQMP